MVPGLSLELANAAGALATMMALGMARTSTMEPEKEVEELKKNIQLLAAIRPRA